MIFDLPPQISVTDFTFKELLAANTQAKLEGTDNTEISQEIDRRITKKMRQLAIEALLKEDQ